MPGLIYYILNEQNKIPKSIKGQILPFMRMCEEKGIATTLKEFGVYGTIENPLFLAKDVAEMIDYDVTSLNKMLASIDDDEKNLIKYSEYFSE